MANTLKIPFFVAGMSIFILVSCRPGVDYAELGYSKNDIIDYGQKAKENKLSSGAQAYALANQNFIGGGTEEFEKDLITIEKSLTFWLDELPHLATFNTAQHENLKSTKEQIEKALAQDVKPKIVNATRSAAGAIELNSALAKIVKSDGILAQLLANLKDDIPTGAVKDFERESKKIVDAFEHLYQLTMIASLVIVQHDAHKLLFTIRKYLNALKERAQESLLFDKKSVDTDGRMAIVAALSKVDEVNGILGHVASKDQVKLSLVSAAKELANSISSTLGVKGRFVDKVTREHSSAVLELYQFAHRALQELEVMINGLDESPKKNADAKLRSLVEKAFAQKIALNLERINADDETELMKLMRLLGSKKVVGLMSNEANDEIVAALSVAVVKNIATKYGLFADNLYGFNYQKLNESRAVFSMSDQAFKDYVQGIAHKMYQTTSNNGQYANIYVIFAERLGPQAAITELINIFKQGKSHVLVIANRPEDYHVESTLHSAGLDLISAGEVAKTIVASLDKRNFASMAEKLVKVMYAFRRVPESFNIVSIENALKDTLARLQENKEPSETEINRALINALGASKEGYDVSLLSNSNAWVDSFGTIKTNVATEQRYYFNEARGIRGTYRDEEQRRRAEQARLDETRRQVLTEQTIRKERKALLGVLKDTRRELNNLKKDLDPAAALLAERTTRKNLIKEIDKLLEIYGRVIEKYYELPIDKLEAFDSASDNQFKVFFKSVIKAAKSREYFANLGDLNAVQTTLRNDAYRYLPSEVLVMLDRYSIWHPYAYFRAALGQTFTQQFGGAAPNPVDIDNAYAGLPANLFEALPAGVHPLKVKALSEFASFRALLYPGGAALPGTPDLMKQALPAGYDNLAQPPALQTVRFEAGTDASVYLANENSGIKALKVIWPDLLRYAGEIQRASGRIYQLLYDVKK